MPDGQYYAILLLDAMRTGAFFAGAALMVAGTVFSAMPYNPGRFQTVHEFALQCHLRSEHFLEVLEDGWQGLTGAFTIRGCPLRHTQ